MCKSNKICGRKARNYLCYQLMSCHACNGYATFYNRRDDLLKGSVHAHINNSGTTILDIGYYCLKKFLDDRYVNDTTSIFYSTRSTEKSWND